MGERKKETKEKTHFLSILIFSELPHICIGHVKMTQFYNFLAKKLSKSLHCQRFQHKFILQNPIHNFHPLRFVCVCCVVLCIVYCVLCIVYCVLCIVYCVLCIVYCVLCIVYCVLCANSLSLLFIDNVWTSKHGRNH